MTRERMTRYQKAYLALFAVSLTVAFSPFKAVAYLLPFLGLLLLVGIGRRWTILRNLGLITMVYILLVLLHAAFGPVLVWPNALLWLVTNGTLIFLLAVPSAGLYNEVLLSAMFRLARGFLLFESLWGLGQALRGYLHFGSFDGAIGDFVSGTIAPFSQEASFANPMFAANLAVLMVFVWTFARRGDRSYPVLSLGMVTLLCTSVLHLILSFFLALGAAQLLCRRFRPRTVVSVALVVLVAIGGLALTQRSNLGLYESYATLILENRLPKVEMTRRVAAELAPRDHFFALFGYGPGQFLSRAGLMATGRYLGTPQHPRKLPLLPSGLTAPQQRQMLDLWETSLWEAGYGGSAMAKPWSSWLAIGSEFGLFGLLAVLLGMGKIVWEASRAEAFRKWQRAAVLLVFMVGFLGLLGLVELYWETSQAVFVGILLAKFIYSLRWHAAADGRATVSEVGL